MILLATKLFHQLRHEFAHPRKQGMVPFLLSQRISLTHHCYTGPEPGKLQFLHRNSPRRASRAHPRVTVSSRFNTTLAITAHDASSATSHFSSRFDSPTPSNFSAACGSLR